MCGSRSAYVVSFLLRAHESQRGCGITRDDTQTETSKRKEKAKPLSKKGKDGENE